MKQKLPLILIFTLSVIGVLAKFTQILTPGSFIPNSSMPISQADTAWMLTSSALVLLMTPGLSFFYGGMVGKKNVISTLFQSFAAMGVISLLWITVGFSLSFGESIGGFIGNPFSYLMMHNVGGTPNALFSATIPFALFALFQMKFAIITPALITGAFAERVKFTSYLLFMTLFSLAVYAPVAHWTWHPSGFLRVAGVLDFAGGTVVHMSAGIAALVSALYLGQRKHTSSNHIPANIPYVLLGTGMLWFGWFGFNAGSALGANELAVQAFLTTNTASAAALLTWMFLQMAKGEKPSALGACVGAVVGLVAVTPAAGYITIGESIAVGTIASTISSWACSVRSTTSIDDTLDVFPCHGIGGIVGMILTGIFADKVGLLSGETHTFIVHILAVIGISFYVGIVTYICLKITDAFIPMRVSETDEILGLDVSQHGEIYGSKRIESLGLQENDFVNMVEPRFVGNDY